MHVGPNMRQVRRLHGKSLEDVAGYIGIDLSQLSRIERSQAEPSLNALKAWLDLFFMNEAALRRGKILVEVEAPLFRSSSS